VCMQEDFKMDIYLLIEEEQPKRDRKAYHSREPKVRREGDHGMPHFAPNDHIIASASRHHPWLRSRKGIPKRIVVRSEEHYKRHKVTYVEANCPACRGVREVVLREEGEGPVVYGNAYKRERNEYTHVNSYIKRCEAGG
jgi:hypothetical protein